jgi:hypothetical protein
MRAVSHGPHVRFRCRVEAWGHRIGTSRRRGDEEDTMSGWIKGSIAAFAVMFGLGLGISAGSLAGADEAKREDDVREVVTIEEGDDRDGGTPSRATTSRADRSQDAQQTRQTNQSKRTKDRTRASREGSRDATAESVSASAPAISTHTSSDRSRDPVSRDSVSRDSASRDSGSRSGSRG